MCCAWSGCYQCQLPSRRTRGEASAPAFALPIGATVYGHTAAIAPHLNRRMDKGRQRHGEWPSAQAERSRDSVSVPRIVLTLCGSTTVLDRCPGGRSVCTRQAFVMTVDYPRSRRQLSHVVLRPFVTLPENRGGPATDPVRAKGIYRRSRTEKMLEGAQLGALTPVTGANLGPSESSMSWFCRFGSVPISWSTA